MKTEKKLELILGALKISPLFDWGGQRYYKNNALAFQKDLKVLSKCLGIEETPKCTLTNSERYFLRLVITEGKDIVLSLGNGKKTFIETKVFVEGTPLPIKTLRKEVHVGR